MPKKISTMTIYREGQFEARAHPGANHCGPASAIVYSQNPKAGRFYGEPDFIGKIPVKYKCWVTCEPKLDDRGFLFDQLSMDDWIGKYVNSFSGSLSCEVLAQRLVSEVLTSIASNSPECKVKKVVLELSPAPHSAAITVEWK